MRRPGKPRLPPAAQVLRVFQISTPATARGPGNASRLLDDDDFTDGLTKIIWKTIRDYCTVGKRNGIGG